MTVLRRWTFGRAVVAAALLTAGTACGGDDLFLPEDSIPASITPLKGDKQIGTVALPAPDSLVVRVLDADDRPVQGQQVTFTVVAGGGSTAPGTIVTDADGRAAAQWILGPAAGVQQVQAKAVGGGAPDNLAVLFTATAGASTAANLAAVSGEGQTAVAGSTLDDSLIVRTTDSDGNPVAGVTVTWTAPGGGTTSAPTTITGADGTTGVLRTLGPAAGPQTTVATANGLAGSPVTFTATAAVGSAGRLVIVQQPSSGAQGGVAFAQQPRVQIQDANGNNVPGAGRAVTAELASGPPGALLQGAATVSTNAAGLAEFTNLAITGAAGDYTLNFTGADLVGATSVPIHLSAGAATRLAFTGQPSNITAGGVIPAVTVAIRDALGQTVTSATNAVTVALGSNPGGGTLSGTRTVNAVNGVATFSALSIDRAGAGYTLVATSPGLSDATSFAFNVSGGAASTISANATMPATTVSGGTVSPDPSVKVVDANGNPIEGVAVTFTVVNGGSVSGPSQTTNAQGLATVGSWTIGTAAGTQYQLQASASGLAGSPVTFSTTAASGAAAQLQIATQPPAAAQSGASLVPQPVVRLADASGNPVGTSGIGVSAVIASGPGGASLSGATATTVDGVATFSSLAITGPAGSYALSFTSPGLAPATSTEITIGSGTATRLGIALQPSATAQNGAAFAQQPVIQLEDAAGNPVAAAGVSVQASISAGSGTLVGTASSTTDAAGRASFSDLGISGGAGDYQLLFAAAGLTAVTSSVITITP